MNEKYSKKQLEELYCCTIFKDNGFDDGHLFWVAYGNPALSEDEPLFSYADGWTLDELHKNIREQVAERLMKV